MKSNDFFERLRIYSETDIEFEPRHSEWLNLKLFIVHASFTNESIFWLMESGDKVQMNDAFL